MLHVDLFGLVLLVPIVRSLDSVWVVPELLLIVQQFLLQIGGEILVLCLWLQATQVEIEVFDLMAMFRRYAFDRAIVSHILGMTLSLWRTFLLGRRPSHHRKLLH